MPESSAPTLDQRYQLLEELGKGGMGVVHKALDTVLDRIVAVKVLKREVLDDQSRERLRREARAAAGLSHPHIVTIFDVVLRDDLAYLVMEHLPGESLRSWQDRVDLSWLELTELSIQLSSALSYSHEAGIIHRDLKPENVIVKTRDADDSKADQEGFPYHATLLDFGLAKPFHASRLTQSGTFVGTASYMSPEQIKGADVDGRSDLYSLGVILYELVAKRRPFEGDSFQNILYRHMHERPRALSQLNEGVDPELEQIILRCLEKPADRRFASAAELRSELVRLRRVLQDRPEQLVTTSLTSGPELPERNPEAVFAGRSQELRDLRLRYQMAQIGEAQLVLVAGQTGVGKSRLVTELCRQSSDSGAQVLRGRFFEQSRSFPFQGFVDLLEDHLRTLRERSPELHDFGELADDLARISPSLAEAMGRTITEPEPADRSLLFETFARVFIRMAMKQPLLVILEDIHWTDLSVELLAFLYRRTSAYRILYVGTYRPEELPERHPILKLASSASGERSFAQLKLEPLSRADTQTLVESFVPAHEKVPLLARKIYEITEGNPFFVIEMMKSLTEQAQGLSTAGVVPHLIELASEASLPSTVRDVVMERVMRLDDELREVLNKASVIGRWFEFEVLHAISDLGEERLMRSLEKLLNAGLILEEPRAQGERFHFASAVLREALYRSVSSRRKRLLHEKVADSLEAAGVLGDPGAIFALAHHYVQAGVVDKSITYTIRAGELARMQAALDDAEGFYLTARDFLDEVDPGGASPRTLSVVRSLGDVYRERGELAKATMTLKETLARLERAGHSTEASEICLDLGRVYAEARHPGRAKEFAVRGIELQGEAGDSETLHGLYRLKADIASLEGEHREAERLHKRAENLARSGRVARQFKRGGEARLAHRDSLQALDPHVSPLQFDASVLSCVFEPLISYGYGTDLVPRLAERWDVSANAQHYHLHLREGVRFHDGKLLDAEDVLCSLMRTVRSDQGYRLLEPVVGAKEFRQGKADSIEGIRILDQTTLEISLVKPLSFFLSILTSVNLAVIPRHMWDEPEILPLGTGPFLVEDYVEGQRLVLKRNSSYHRPGFPNMERVTMEFDVTSEGRVERFLEKDTDLITDLLPEEVRAISRKVTGSVIRREVTSLGTNYLLVQKKIAPFNDPRVRKALGMVIDRQALQRSWEKGLAIPATTLLPPDLLGYQSRDRSRRPRLDEARSLLGQAGVGDGFETEIVVRRASPLSRSDLLTELARQLKEVGIRLTTNSLPDDEYADVLEKGDAALVLQGWVADYPDPDSFLHSLFMSSVGRARAFLSSPALDALITKARAETSREERRNLYLKAEELIREEGVLVPLSHDREVVNFHPHVRGLLLRLMSPHVELDRLWVSG